MRRLGSVTVMVNSCCVVINSRSGLCQNLGLAPNNSWAVRAWHTLYMPGHVACTVQELIEG